MTGTAGPPIQARACSVAKRVAWSGVSKMGTKRRTRSCVMLPRPLRMETAAAKRPPSRGRVRGETMYLPTCREVWMRDPSGTGRDESASGLTRTARPGARLRRMNSVRRLARRVVRRGQEATRLGDHHGGQEVWRGWRSTRDLGAAVRRYRPASMRAKDVHLTIAAVSEPDARMRGRADCTRAVVAVACGSHPRASASTCAA